MVRDNYSYEFLKVSFYNALLNGRWSEVKMILASKKLKKKDVDYFMEEFLVTEDVDKVYKKNYVRSH